MGQLNNLYVSSSYQGLLKMTDSTNGLTNTLQTVQTGDGDNSPLQMSLTQVNISGSFSVNGIIITGATSGTSGTSGQNGSSGTSGTSGSSGSSGTGFNYLGSWDNTVSYNTNDVITYNGQTYVSLQNGNLNKQPSVQPAWWTVFSAAGSSGTSGTSGTSGSSGSSGTSGSSGSSGTSGSSGSAGTSGTSGGTGSSGTSGSSGSSGTSGSNGSSGSSGTSGSSGSSGTSGADGLVGSNGTSGTSGTSGSSGTSGGSPFAQTGSVWATTNNIQITGSLDIRSGSLDLFSNNTTVNTDLYLTNSLGGQSNIIKGWSDNPAAGGSPSVQANYTGSLRITGSNNIVSMPQIRASGPPAAGADSQGYISGSDNIINGNNAGIFLNTGSLLFPKTQGNTLSNSSYIVMNFTTSSLAGGHPIVGFNTINAGSIYLTSNSGSLSSVSLNLINGGSILSNQNFVTNTRPSIGNNTVSNTVTLNHISSSINYTANWSNSPITINNHLSSSALTAGNSVNLNNNLIVGGGSATGPSIYISGSQSSATARTFANNLLGGNNLQISSSFVSSSNSNLISTIIYGSNLAVSGSHSSATVGGSAFFGRYNATGSNQEDSQQVVFAVGTGTGTAARRTGFLIDSGSNVIISGSINQSGSLKVSGNINDLKIWTGSATVNSIGIGTNTLLSSTGSSLNNVAIGDSALRQNVVGANSVAIGNASLQNSLEGFNVGIGSSTLTALSIGESNIAIGSSSTQALTGGTKNTAIGFNSLVGVVSGSWNTAIGAGTLQRNTIGSNCVAIGNQAGSWSTNSNEFFVGNDNYGSQVNEQSSSLFYGKFNNTTVNQSLQINAGDVKLPLIANETGSYFVMMDSSKSLRYATPEQALPALFDVGYFYSTQTQSGSANVSSSYTFDNTAAINEITVSGSQIIVPKTAWYNFQFSIQAVQGSGAADVAVWLKKNGTNVTNTATYVTIASNHKSLIALNIWEQVTSGSYIELAYQSDSNNTTYQYIAPTGNIPGSPSVIMSVNQIR